MFNYPTGVDWTILVIGLIRTVAWSIGVYYAYRAKSTAAVAGFTLACVSSLFFAFLNAGADVNDGVLVTGASAGTPIAVLMTIAISRRPQTREHWEL